MSVSCILIREVGVNSCKEQVRNFLRAELLKIIISRISSSLWVAGFPRVTNASPVCNGTTGNTSLQSSSKIYP